MHDRCITDANSCSHVVDSAVATAETAWRSRLNSSTSVPVKSLTVTMSAPPSPPLTGVDHDLCDLAALEVEFGRAVVAEVDIEGAGLAGLQPEGDPVIRVCALDREQPVLERRLFELSPLPPGCRRQPLLLPRSPAPGQETARVE